MSVVSIGSKCPPLGGPAKRRKQEHPPFNCLSDFAKRELRVATTGIASCCKARATTVVKQYKIPNGTEGKFTQLCDSHGSVYFDAWSFLAVDKFVEAIKDEQSETHTQILESMAARKDDCGSQGPRQNYTTYTTVEKTVKIKTSILNAKEFLEVIEQKPLQEFIMNRPTTMVPKLGRLINIEENVTKQSKGQPPSDSDEKVWVCKHDHTLASYRSMSWKICIGGEL